MIIMAFKQKQFIHGQNQEINISDDLSCRETSTTEINHISELRQTLSNLEELSKGNVIQTIWAVKDNALFGNSFC